MNPDTSLRIAFNGAVSQTGREAEEDMRDWTGMGTQSFSYGDSGVFFICESACMACGLHKPVAAFDTSAGEYGPVFICRDCVNAAFDRYAAGERTEG